MTTAVNTGTGNDGTTNAPAGHDAAMAAKFDQQQQQQPTPGKDQQQQEAPKRPDYLPEKFWKDGKADLEGLAKSYGELERSRGQQQQKQSAQNQNDAARQQVENAGLDFDALSKEFFDKGELSSETYDALAARGIPKEAVDSYVNGQQAIANQIRADILGKVGGEEKYVEMVSWASDNMSTDEVVAYNAIMNSGDGTQIALAVEGLRSRFVTANGEQPQLLNGGSGHNQNAGDVFRSVAELTTAMKDPRYPTDPAYRNDVQLKLGRSKIM